MPFRIVLRYICFIALSLLCVHSSEAKQGGQVLLDTLQRTRLSEQAKVFSHLFKQYIWDQDSAEALQEFEQLKRNSLFEENKELYIVLTTAKGLYYQQRVKDGLPLAIDVFKEALEVAREEKQEIHEARIAHFIGYTYYLLEEHLPAFEYMLEADQLMKEIGYGDFPDYSSYSYRMATIYYSLANYARAREYVDLSIKFSGSNNAIRRSAYCFNGVLEREEKNYKEAKSWYEKALKIALEEGDSGHVAIFKGNIGRLNSVQGLNDVARPLIQDAFELGKKYGDLRNTLISLLVWADLEAKENNIELARENITLFDSLREIHNFKPNIDQLSDYYLVLSRIYTADKEFEKAKAYQDTFIVYKDSLQAERDASIVTNIEVRAMTEKHLADIALMKEEERRQNIIRNASIILLGMFLILFTVIIYHLKKRQKQKERIFLLQSQKAEEQLQNYRNRLRFFIEGIREKNRLIEELQKEREEQDELGKTGISRVASSGKVLERLYASVILTDEDWHNFKMLFEKAYPGLLEKMQIEYPKLTTSDLRVLSLVKLNLSNTEMSGMLGISLESVSQSRWRIRKKLRLKDSKQIPALMDRVWKGNSFNI